MANVGAGLTVHLERLKGRTPKNVLRQPLYLPAVLNDFTVDEDATHRDYETLRAGEFSQPAPGHTTDTRRLRTAPTEFLTLDWDAKWTVNQALSPEKTKKELERVIRSRKPCLLVAVIQHGGGDRREELVMKVTLRRISRTLKHGEPDTRYWTIEPKEWRDPSSGRRTHGGGGGLPTTYRLKATTTLYKLAKKFYGSTKNWRNIANVNGLRDWGPSTPIVKKQRYKVGDKVKIPEKPTGTGPRAELEL